MSPLRSFAAKNQMSEIGYDLIGTALTVPRTRKVSDFRGEGVTGLDAIGQGDAIARISADEKTRMLTFASRHWLKETLVADVVLRNRFGPERVMREHRVSGDTEECAQIG